MTKQFTRALMLLGGRVTVPRSRNFSDCGIRGVESGCTNPKKRKFFLLGISHFTSNDAMIRNNFSANTRINHSVHAPKEKFWVGAFFKISWPNRVCRGRPHRHVLAAIDNV